MAALKTAFLACTLLTVLFAGCLGSDSGSKSVSSSSAPPPTASSGEAAPTTSKARPTASSSSAPKPSDEASPPAAAFKVSSGNLTAGASIDFDASGSEDPAGGSLSYAWDFGDGKKGEGAKTNHSFESAGLYTVKLSVTSDASGLSDDATQDLNVSAAGPQGRQPVTIKDPADDGTTPLHDLLDVVISDDETNLIVKFTLSQLQPGSENDGISCQSIFIKTQRYEPYGFAGEYFVYDYKKDGDMAGAKVATKDNEVTVTLPLGGIGLSFPFDVRLESRGGECSNLGGNENAILDLAPDKGAVTYG